MLAELRPSLITNESAYPQCRQDPLLFVRFVFFLLYSTLNFVVVLFVSLLIVENVRLISDRENNSDAKNIANEKGREEKRSWSDVVRGSSRKVEENGSEGLGNCKPTDQRDDGSSH